MNKNFKKALLVAPAACLALSLGMFAAACTPEEPGETPHEHSFTEWAYEGDYHWQYCPDCPEEATTDRTLHTFDTNDECECGASTKTEIIDVGGAPFTVDGATGVAFVKDFGTYEMFVEGLTGTDKEYKITVGENEYTVNAENKSFVFNVNPDDSVHVYNPDATATAKSYDATGVRMVITPKADYSDGETPDTVEYTITPVSVTLKNGSNESLFVGAPVIHKYFVSASGDYTFDFDVAEGDGFTVEFAGKKYTVNAESNTFTVTLQSSSNAYAFTVTPAEGNVNDEVDVYVAQPKKEFTAVYGNAFLLSSSNYPDLIYIYNGEVDVEVAVSGATGTYAIVGETYNHNFSVFVGEDEVGVFNGADPDGNKTSVNLTLNLREDHFNDGKVVLTFKFDVKDSDEPVYLYAALTEPATAADNSVLHLVYGTDSEDVTICAAEDEKDGKYTYTFTATETGWYAVNIFGSFGVNYSVGEATGTLNGWSYVEEKFSLEANQTISVVLWDGVNYNNDPVTPVDATIAVTTAEAPKEDVVDATNELVEGNIKIEFAKGTSYDGVVYGFTSAEGGSYTISVVKPAANGQEIVFAADASGNVDYNTQYLGDAEYGYKSSYSFTLAAGETKYFAFGDNWSQDNSYIVRIEKAVPVVTVSDGDEITEAGKFEVTVINAGMPGLTTPVTVTFKPAEAGTYKITSHDDTTYFIASVNGRDVIYYDMGAEEYVAEGTFEVTSAGVTMVLDGDMGHNGTYQFTISKV